MALILPYNNFDDLFLYTIHTETVVLLSKNFSKPKEYVQIGIDAEDYYRIKDSEKGVEGNE